jgi:uncharacterized protein
MEISVIGALRTQVLWAGFILSVLFGAIAQRSHFCAVRAVSDIFTMGDWTRMRMWGMTVSIVMIGFASLVAAGQIDTTKTLYASSRLIWLSAFVGGSMFGFGMVPAAGCGSKTLVGVGGSLKSRVVFIVMGVAVFTTLGGITVLVRATTVDRVALDFSNQVALPNWVAGAIGLAPATAGVALALLTGVALFFWALSGSGFLGLNNLLGGLGTGAVVTAMWWVSGHLGYVAEHPETLQEAFLATSSGRAEALSFVEPFAYMLDWLMFFSDKSKVLMLGIVSVFGVLAGSALVAVASRSFRWEGFRDASDTANHLVQATLTGVGGVAAIGCTAGQRLSGISTLSSMSFIAVGAIIAGATAGLRFQMWRLKRAVSGFFRQIHEIRIAC